MENYSFVSWHAPHVAKIALTRGCLFIVLKVPVVKSIRLQIYSKITYCHNISRMFLDLVTFIADVIRNLSDTRLIFWKQ